MRNHNDSHTPRGQAIGAEFFSAHDTSEMVTEFKEIKIHTFGVVPINRRIRHMMEPPTGHQIPAKVKTDTTMANNLDGTSKVLTSK